MVALAAVECVGEPVVMVGCGVDCSVDECVEVVRG